MGFFSSPAARGSAFYFAFFAVLAAWLPFVNVYFRSLGLSGWQIGVLSALIPAAAFLLAPPLTALADRHGRHLTMLTVATAGMGATMALFVFSTRFWILFAVMTLSAICFSPLTPLADSTIAGMAVRHGLNYGSMRLWGSFGFALVATAGGAIWSHTGYLAMFVVSAVLYLGVAWAAGGLEESIHIAHQQRVPFRAVLSNRFLIMLLAATFVVAAAVGIDMAFSGVYMTHLGGSGLFVGLVFGFSALFELPMMRYSQPLAERIGGPACLLLSYGLFGCAYLGYALSTGPAIMLGFSIFRGLAFGLFYAGTVRILTESAPVEWASALQGIMNGLAFGLAQLLSRPLGGAIYDTLGPSMVFFTGTGVIACGMVLMGSTMIVPALKPERHTSMSTP